MNQKRFQEKAVEAGRNRESDRQELERMTRALPRARRNLGNAAIATAEARKALEAACAEVVRAKGEIPKIDNNVDLQRLEDIVNYTDDRAEELRLWNELSAVHRIIRNLSDAYRQALTAAQKVQQCTNNADLESRTIKDLETGISQIELRLAAGISKEKIPAAGGLNTDVLGKLKAQLAG